MPEMNLWEAFKAAIVESAEGIKAFAQVAFVAAIYVTPVAAGFLVAGPVGALVGSVAATVAAFTVMFWLDDRPKEDVLYEFKHGTEAYSEWKENRDDGDSQ